MDTILTFLNRQLIYEDTCNHISLCFIQQKNNEVRIQLINIYNTVFSKCKTKQIIHKKGRYTIKNTMKIKMAAQGLMAFAALLSFLDPASCCEAPLAPADLSSVFASVEDGQIGPSIQGVFSSDLRTSLLSQLLTLTRVQVEGCDTNPALVPYLRQKKLLKKSKLPRVGQSFIFLSHTPLYQLTQKRIQREYKAQASHYDQGRIQ